VKRLPVEELQKRRNGFRLIEEEQIDIVFAKIELTVKLERIKLKVAAVEAGLKVYKDESDAGMRQLAAPDVRVFSRVRECRSAALCPGEPGPSPGWT